MRECAPATQNLIFFQEWLERTVPEMRHAYFFWGLPLISFLAPPFRSLSFVSLRLLSFFFFLRLSLLSPLPASQFFLREQIRHIHTRNIYTHKQIYRHAHTDGAFIQHFTQTHRQQHDTPILTQTRHEDTEKKNTDTQEIGFAIYRLRSGDP